MSDTDNHPEPWSAWMDGLRQVSADARKALEVNGPRIVAAFKSFGEALRPEK